MRLIKRVIRQQHVQAIIDETLYFSPCKTFVDLLEFRFGYCWDEFELARAEGKPEIFERCIRNSFSDDHVRRRIDETVISCWSYNAESPYMWEVYGGGKPAIIVTLKADELWQYVKQKCGENAVPGPVRYGFKPPITSNLVFPEFIGTSQEDCDLFFHKHEFYTFEQEFRAVVFGHHEALRLSLPKEMVIEITLSPVAPLEPAVLAALKKQFGDRVRNSRLSWSLAQPRPSTIEDYMADKRTPKSLRMVELFEELKRLRIHGGTTGWNDPKAPPLTQNQIEIGGKIAEVEKELRQQIAQVIGS